jgi:hypothetical protein
MQRDLIAIFGLSLVPILLIGSVSRRRLDSRLPQPSVMTT